VTDDQREEINRQKRLQTRERYRRKKGMKPRHQSASRLKTWEKEGFNCRRTWERHRKRQAEAVSQKRDSHLLLNNQCPTLASATHTKPTLPEGWPYCTNHVVCTDCGRTFRVGIDTEPFQYQEAA
jgi:hypothetical protein